MRSNKHEKKGKIITENRDYAHIKNVIYHRAQRQMRTLKPFFEL